MVGFLTEHKRLVVFVAVIVVFYAFVGVDLSIKTGYVQLTGSSQGYALTQSSDVHSEFQGFILYKDIPGVFYMGPEPEGGYRMMVFEVLCWWRLDPLVLLIWQLGWNV